MIILRSIFLVVSVASSAVSAAEPPRFATPSQLQAKVPPPPLPQSPIEHFRQILAMTPEQRAKALEARSPKAREFLEAKLKEYEALRPEDRANRLRTLELRYHLVPLMKMPPSNRVARLETIAERDRGLIEDRLALWDKLSPELQRDVLVCEPAIAAFVGPETRLSPSPTGSPLTPQQQENINRSTAYLNSLPTAKRSDIYRNFQEFFELSEREKAKALDSIGALSEAERQQMERALQAFDKLPRDQREQCIEGFQKFTALTPRQRDEFLRSAERWEAMSAQDRKIWRSLVARKAVPAPPPLPPGAGFPSAGANSSSIHVVTNSP